MDFSILSLAEYVKMAQNGEFSVAEGVKYFANKIADDKHNAVLEVFESAANRATELDNKKANGEPLGKLFGAPIIIKDNILYKGHRCGCASKILKDFIAPYSATVVEKMLAEDAVILGRANMDEFAMGSTGETSAYGPTHNAVKMGYVAGGSSSGSAVSVAAGLCVAALGTDTGGSVRCPASFNGIYGLKPTYGKISRYGVIAYASSLDQVGPLCKTAEDTHIMLDIICGKDDFDGTTIDFASKDFDIDCKSFTIGVVKEAFANRDKHDDAEAFDKLTESFKNAGLNLVEVSLPMLDLVLPTYYIIAPAEAASNLARFDGVKYTSASKTAKNLEELYKKTRSEYFGAEVKRRIMLGNFVLSSGYFDAYYNKAKRVQGALKYSIGEAFKKVDMLLMPVMLSGAFKMGNVEEDPLKLYLVDLFTTTANIAGVPALAVPFTKNAEGLPVGFQILANEGDDNKLFAFAKMFESELKGGF